MANYNDDKEKDPKKNLRIVLTILGYVLLAYTLLTILPVILPKIFGYTINRVETDYTGQVHEYASVVYTSDKVSADALVPGNIVAVVSDDANKVNVFYVDSNNSESQTISLRGSDAASYSEVVGNVVAKTPFIAIFTQVMDYVVGIIVAVLLLVLAIVLLTIANKTTKQTKKN